MSRVLLLLVVLVSAGPQLLGREGDLLGTQSEIIHRPFQRGREKLVPVEREVSTACLS